jgi:hypothetical protein
VGWKRTRCVPAFPDSSYSDTIRAEKLNGRGLRTHSRGASGHAPTRGGSKRRGSGKRPAKQRRGTKRGGPWQAPLSHSTTYNRTIALYFSMIIFRDSEKPAAAIR